MERSSFSIWQEDDPSHVIIPTYSSMGEYSIFNKDNITQIFIPSTVIFTHHPDLATYPMEECDNLVIYTDAMSSSYFTTNWNKKNLFETYTTYYGVTDFNFYGYHVEWRSVS